MKKQLMCPLLLLLCFMGFSAIAIAETTPATALEVAVPADIVAGSPAITKAVPETKGISGISVADFKTITTTETSVDCFKGFAPIVTAKTTPANALEVATSADIVAGFSLTSS